MQVADHLAVAFIDQKLSVAGVRAARHAVGQRLDRIGLLDDDRCERGTDDIVVYRRECHRPDRRNRWDVSDGRRANDRSCIGLGHAQRSVGE